jgi:hypothetical protein
VSSPERVHAKGTCQARADGGAAPLLRKATSPIALLARWVIFLPIRHCLSECFAPAPFLTAALGLLLAADLHRLLLFAPPHARGGANRSRRWQMTRAVSVVPGVVHRGQHSGRPRAPCRAADWPRIASPPLVPRGEGAGGEDSSPNDHHPTQFGLTSLVASLQ